VLNFMGLLPYHLPFTASISMIIPIALPFIVITFIYVLFLLEDLICHFTPSGTPSILLRAINLIEGIRLGVRWLTLTGRIVGNITCSHCLICLLETPSILVISLVVLVIMHLEFIVCIIQGIVPYILFYSYLSERK
jgi:F0F1-type ATP synthase membrane subunit a